MGNLQNMEHLGCEGCGCGPSASLLAEKEQRARVLDGCDGYNQTVGAPDTGAIVAGCGTGLGKGVRREESAGRALGSGFTEASKYASCVGLGKQARVGVGESGGGDLPCGVQAYQLSRCGFSRWGRQAKES
jgi:hypothetical protein